MVAAGDCADTSAMRGLVTVAAALCLFVLISPAWSGAAGGSAVGVSEREWSVALSRLKVQHGTITFSIHNFGQDDHNIKIRKHGWQYGFSGRIRSGGTATITVNLKPGVYSVFCGIPGHRALGMNAKLTVT
jgi:plastocyanin